MKILKWYSAIAVSYSILACFQSWAVNTQDSISFWAVVMYTPIAFYLWKIIAEENRVKKA